MDVDSYRRLIDSDPDDANWLVFADWLEDRGDARAAYARGGVEARRLFGAIAGSDPADGLPDSDAEGNAVHEALSEIAERFDDGYRYVLLLTTATLERVLGDLAFAGRDESHEIVRRLDEEVREALAFVETRREQAQSPEDLVAVARAASHGDERVAAQAVGAVMAAGRYGVIHEPTWERHVLEQVLLEEVPPEFVMPIEPGPAPRQFAGSRVFVLATQPTRDRIEEIVAEVDEHGGMPAVVLAPGGDWRVDDHDLPASVDITWLAVRDDALTREFVEDLQLVLYGRIVEERDWIGDPVYTPASARLEVVGAESTTSDLEFVVRFSQPFGPAAEQHRDEIIDRIEAAPNVDERERLQLRLARLFGKVVRIRVHADDEIRGRRLCSLTWAAVMAVRNGIESGILRSDGTFYAVCSSMLRRLSVTAIQRGALLGFGRVAEVERPGGAESTSPRFLVAGTVSRGIVACRDAVMKLVDDTLGR